MFVPKHTFSRLNSVLPDPKVYVLHSLTQHSLILSIYIYLFNSELLDPKHIQSLFYAFFWVIPRHLNFICQRFGTLRLFHLHRWIGMNNSYFIVPAYEDETDRVFRNVGI